MVFQKEGSSTDTLLTPEDFTSSGWEEAFQDNEASHSTVILNVLISKGQKAAEEGKVAQSKVLYLLVDVCSMQLHPSSLNEPFICFTHRIGRSSIPDDFSEEDIEYFLRILPLISYPWLKARLADLIWLRRRSQVDIALIAIDSYLMAPISQKSFVGEGGDLWIRAITLTNILKKAAGKRMENIQERIVEAIDKATEKDGFLAVWLSNLMKRFRLGVSYANDIAEKLVSLAATFKSQKDFHKARGHYEASSYWFLKANNEQESFNSIMLQAEVWQTESVSKETSRDFIGAAHSLEKAIQSYRLIPHKYRTLLGMQEGKLQQLQQQLGILGRSAAESMTLVSTPSIDITNMVTESRLLIQGKTAFEALKTLVNFYPGAKRAEIRKIAEQELTQFHLSSFFGSTVRLRDGRVVSKNPGMASVAKDTNQYEEVVKKEMLRIYYLQISVSVQGRIFPALESMIAEHRMQEKDFVSICSQSSIVPLDRVSAFAKALFAGYDLDFDSVIHRLVPQLENMVRYHLKAAGAVTTTLDEDGIEMEVNLSALLEREEVIRVFGEDVVFEMKALFCENCGPNFRHDLAHGLLEDKDFESTLAVYAWCFGLRLVFNVFWNDYKKE